MTIARRISSQSYAPASRYSLEISTGRGFSKRQNKQAGNAASGAVAPTESVVGQRLMPSTRRRELRLGSAEERPAAAERAGEVDIAAR
jgi:hypothetical protein